MTTQERNSLVHEIFTINDILRGRLNKNTEREKEPILSPILFGQLKTSAGKVKPSRIKHLRILLDSGSSESIIAKSAVEKNKLTEEPAQVWNTAAGQIETNKKTNVHFLLSRHFS